MAQLAIKGNAFRGKEVIEILEMLGGKNDDNCCGEFIFRKYFINENGYIESCDIMHHIEYHQFTLEEFLEKFSYKVGDKVKNSRIEDFVGTIINARWDNNEEEVIYDVEWNDGSELSYFVRGLKPYEEKIMEQTKRDLDWRPTDYLEFVDNDEWADEVELNIGKSYKIVLRHGKYYAVKNKPKYPNTFEECCKVLGINATNGLLHDDNRVILAYKIRIVAYLQELLICRDAYWKMAEDWKPDWDNIEQEKYSIEVVRNIIGFYDASSTQKILVFPIAEMRDAFYKNFKDLIEECKELL